MVKSKLSKCIEWTGNLTAKGYGQFRMRGVTFSAHRVAWLLANGGGLTNLNVLHKCDNRKCINPDHLFLGTNKTNVEDRQKKGRQSKGEKHPKAKLNSKDVRSIRRLVSNGIKISVVARKYDVHWTTIWNIILGKTWSHLK